MGRRGRQLLKLTAALGAIGAAGVVYGVGIERNAFTLRRMSVPILPAGRPAITILHLSDIHLMDRQLWKTRWIAQLDELAPDFIVNTGDNLSEARALPRLAEALSPFEGIPGVFVFGSNDLFAPKPVNPLRYLRSASNHHDRPPLPNGALRQLLESFGWQDIEEARQQFTINQTTFETRGTADAHRDADDYAAVAGPPQAGSELLIGVTHAPYRRVLDAMIADGDRLILAGHTHGGQVCLPNGRALVTNCDLPVELAKGLHQLPSSTTPVWLNVSAGLGTSPHAPYRFFCRPEASLLTLTAVDLTD
ncbi:MAG: metallophosphoesterase family protein [Propionibacteriaceae bacterium]|jgi:predicted MPP superfamily phosphohydrolase|nr:metallophosphoesterase family protein [Propionibacteriaceae bacterium]